MKKQTSYIAAGALTMAAVMACSSSPKKEVACASSQGRQPAEAQCDAVAIDYTKVQTDDGHVGVIAMRGKTLESPVVSGDGKMMIAISDLLGKAPVDIVVKDLTKPNDMGTKLKKPLMNLFIKGSFMAHDDEIVACELEFRLSALPKTIENHFKTGEWDPIGYHSVISFYKKGQRVNALDASAFGLPNHTFLEHPRVSQDQQWLTFYVQPGTEMPDPSTQGIYLYNFATKKTVYLGNHADKHPTFSPDGKRIFFHEQGAMADKTEIARIGYYDLDIAGNEVRVKDRVLLADPSHNLGETYIYQKHPAYHEGLNMVFFHAREGEGCTGGAGDCKKVIAGISLDHPERGPIKMKVTYNGQKVSHAEHVDVSDQPDSPLYFVGRVEGEKNDRVLRLDFAALQAAKSAADHK